ncbi:MAG: hypothetical protein E6Q97_38525 [Desulfurellales bacterium]|nr:MAG: hypothetical protein E6Q97_38525 [Desulfurellales bacterium]
MQVGEHNICSEHGPGPRGEPCAQCVADPSEPLSNRDVLRVSPYTCEEHERAFVRIADACEKLADEIADDKRIVKDRTEPLELARKFLDTSVKARGRALEIAVKRDAEQEMARNRAALLEMQRKRGAH